MGNPDLSSDNSRASLAGRAYRSTIRSIFDAAESHQLWLRRFLYVWRPIRSVYSMWREVCGVDGVEIVHHIDIYPYILE